MSENPNLLEIVCPHCHTVLWIDPATRSVIRAEKGGAKPKSSLDELLEKEHKRRSEFDQKFEATAELEKHKRQKAREKFDKAMSGKDSDDEDK